MHQSLPEFNHLRETINFEIIELLQKNNIDLAAARQEIKLTQADNPPDEEHPA